MTLLWSFAFCVSKQTNLWSGDPITQSFTVCDTAFYHAPLSIHHQTQDATLKKEVNKQKKKEQVILGVDLPLVCVLGTDAHLLDGLSLCCVTEVLICKVCIASRDRPGAIIVGRVLLQEKNVTCKKRVGWSQHVIRRTIATQ